MSKIPDFDTGTLLQGIRRWIMVMNINRKLVYMRVLNLISNENLLFLKHSDILNSWGLFRKFYSNIVDLYAVEITLKY